MLVLNLPFKALMFLTLMRPSLVLFLVLWLKLDRKSGSAGMPRPISYAVFCLKKKDEKVELLIFRRLMKTTISSLMHTQITPAVMYFDLPICSRLNIVTLYSFPHRSTLFPYTTLFRSITIL